MKYILFLILGIVVASIAFFAFNLGSKYKLQLTPVASPEATSFSPSPVAVTSPTPTSVDETAMLITVIKQQLVAKHGPDAASLNVTVSKIEGNYATGGASGQGGGGMWLSAKVNDSWALVWDGNGTISCSVIAPYNFPTDLVPECWNDATQKLITR